MNYWNQDKTYITSEVFALMFGFYPMYPTNIDFDQDEYAKELAKYLINHFDYTIEKYGTIPLRKLGRPTIIYD